MPGRIGISSIVYSKAFITKAWADRSLMQEYERRGFFQFLYITACGHAESIICDFLKSVLFLSIYHIERTSKFPDRKFIDNGTEFILSTEPQKRVVERLLRKTVEDLEKASLAGVESLHRTVIGASVRETIGPDLHDKLKGLVSVRNVLAHGRLLYVDIDDSNIADASFEQHPFENAIKSLRHANIFKDSEASSADPNDLYSVIYKDDVLLYFWNTSIDIGKYYRNRADQEKLVRIAWTPSLDPLA
jgi:hypothetical protein